MKPYVEPDVGIVSGNVKLYGESDLGIVSGNV